MRVNPIYTYNRFISAPKNKQVSFGLIEKGNEDKIKAALPKQSEYRIPFDTQWEHLKAHPAITLRLRSENGKETVYATINKGFEKTHVMLDVDDFTKSSYLEGLQGQDEFDGFYSALDYCDYNIKYPNGSGTYRPPSGDTRSQFEIDMENGFGVKIC